MCYNHVRFDLVSLLCVCSDAQPKNVVSFPCIGLWLIFALSPLRCSLASFRGPVLWSPPRKASWLSRQPHMLNSLYAVSQIKLPHMLLHSHPLRAPLSIKKPSEAECVVLTSLWNLTHSGVQTKFHIPIQKYLSFNFLHQRCFNVMVSALSGFPLAVTYSFLAKASFFCFPADHLLIFP